MAINPQDPKHTVHQRVVNAFKTHWRAHDNKYPALIKLPPEQARHLDAVMHLNKHPGSMWGVPIQADPSTAGEMVAVDGSVISMAPEEPAAA